MGMKNHRLYPRISAFKDQANRLQVKVPSSLKKGTFYLMDATGKIVKKYFFNISNGKQWFYFPIQNITPGLYFIQLVGEKRSFANSVVLG